MKSTVFILVLLLTGITYGQANYSAAIRALELPVLEFGKVSDGIDLNENLFSSDFFTRDYKIKSDLFKTVKEFYNTDKEFYMAVCDFKNQRLNKKNVEEVYSILESTMGSPFSVSEAPFEYKVYVFKDGDYKIVLEHDYRSHIESGIKLSKRSLKVVSSYDDFTKNTTYRVSGMDPLLVADNGQELFIEFYGVKSSDNVDFYIKVGSESGDWTHMRNLYVLFSDGNVTELELNPNKNVEQKFGTVVAEERAFVQLPKGILTPEFVNARFRMSGERNNDFILTEDMQLSFKMLINHLGL